MEQRGRLVELFHYLQDPYLVARFQQICGVRGSFSRTVSAGSIAATNRTRAHNNGACHRHITEKNESEHPAVIGAGDGVNVHPTAASVRKRTADDERGNPPQNGAALHSVTAGGEAVVVGSDGRRLAGAPGTDHGEQGATESDQVSQVAAGPPGSSTLKPLRKNSLTGDAGQEFIIENRFLYYLFTFGTELGNELFYIIFFPFIMWNMDAFVSRRLIMVWVWVMYLGQCTKDVIGWSRPASPPVVKVEMFYNSEYSMPSTHAMSGTAIPFSLFFMTYGRWEVRYSHLYLKYLNTRNGEGGSISTS